MSARPIWREELIAYPISVIACLHGNGSPESRRGHERYTENDGRVLTSGLD
jgi:hypothetical protein